MHDWVTMLTAEIDTTLYINYTHKFFFFFKEVVTKILWQET